MPRPPLTLAQLRKVTCWVWAYCQGRECYRGRPAGARGETASSDLLRRSYRCLRCGGKGATLILPSHVGGIGQAPFPSKRVVGGENAHYDADGARTTKR
jgi:hypothetical protein